MNSFRCPQCGLPNFATATVCKRCKTEFNSSSINNAGGSFEHSNYVDAASANFSSSLQSSQFENYQTVQSEQPYFNSPADDFSFNNYSVPSYGSAPAKQKTGLALASMIIGCVGFFACWGLFGVASLTGLVLGIVALVKINKNPVEYGGKGFAIAGTILNGLLLLFVPIILAIAIPNLLAARRAANEESAISSLRTLIGAETTYLQYNGNWCGDLTELKGKNLIDQALAAGSKSGYNFTISKKADGNCDLNATPQSESAGSRSFYVSTVDQEIRGATKKGLPADARDPMLRMIKPSSR